MEADKKDRLVNYGALAGAVAVAIVSVIDYQTSRDLATIPAARPDAFTGTDARALKEDLRRECSSNNAFLQSQLDELQQEHEALRERYDLHVEWGRQRIREDTGLLQRHDAQIQELYRRLP